MIEVIENFWETIKNEWQAQVVFFGFIALTIWWAYLNLTATEETSRNFIFAAVYGIIAAWGGLWGIVIAKEWGGFKSIFGKAIIVLSLGLFAEEFGQIVFSYFNIVRHIDVPYPSLADVGFFSNIPLYLIGIILLAKASGVQFNSERLSHKIQIILIPAVILLFSYMLFLQKYEFDWSDPVKIFLDFGYPLGQALYVSIAFLTYSLSKGVLGGIMKSRILFFVFAFLIQYLSDFNFLYQSSRGTWLNGGYGDYLYLVAYFIMTIALLQLKTVVKKLRG